MARGLLLCTIAVAIAGCAGSTNAPIRTATVGKVKSAFAQYGMPLKAIGANKFAGYRVDEFEYDPAKLVTKNPAGHIVLTGQWLIVLVFENTSAAAHALHDSREARAIRSFGLTVVARGNVVGTILRGDASRNRLQRVRSAVQHATSA